MYICASLSFDWQNFKSTPATLMKAKAKISSKVRASSFWARCSFTFVVIISRYFYLSLGILVVAVRLWARNMCSIDGKNKAKSIWSRRSSFNFHLNPNLSFVIIVIVHSLIFEAPPSSFTWRGLRHTLLCEWVCVATNSYSWFSSSHLQLRLTPLTNLTEVSLVCLTGGLN